MSLWDSALWGVDRWPVLSIPDLLQQLPDESHGVPLGVGDWRFSVQVLLPSDQLAIWGVAEWDETDWPTNAWYDITSWCRGVEWSRGSDEPYGRPRVGTLSMTLDSRNNEFSPWKSPSPSVGSPGESTPTWWSPGTIVRVGLRSATDTRARGWLPQFCGIVDSWNIDYVTANLADQFVTVTAVETLRDLAQIDDNALSSAVGSGENPVDRMERLLDAAGWRFGLLLEAQNLISSPGSYPLQSTDMAANRLTECYLVADACDVYFRTDRTGAAILTNYEYVGLVGNADSDLVPLVEFSYDVNQANPAIGFDWYEREGASNPTLLIVPFRPDSFQSTNSDENVVNDARFARAGGTQQVYEQVSSISRYGRRTLVRNDFINNSDPPVALIAELTTERRALNVMRVNNVTMDPVDRMSDDYALAVFAMDVQSDCYAFNPDGEVNNSSRPYIRGFVRSMTHRVTPRNTGDVTWEVSVALDTREVFRIPGAQLPAS